MKYELSSLCPFFPRSVLVFLSTVLAKIVFAIAKTQPCSQPTVAECGGQMTGQTDRPTDVSKTLLCVNKSGEFQKHTGQIKHQALSNDC